MAAMCADPDVMWDYGYVNARAESDARIARYLDAYLASATAASRCSTSAATNSSAIAASCPCSTATRWRWASRSAGVSPVPPGVTAMPPNPPAPACITASEQCGLSEFELHPRNDNTRSENVMKRLGLTFVPDRFWIHEGHRYVLYVQRASA